MTAEERSGVRRAFLTPVAFQIAGFQLPMHEWLSSLYSRRGEVSHCYPLPPYEILKDSFISLCLFCSFIHGSTGMGEKLSSGENSLLSGWYLRVSQEDVTVSSLRTYAKRARQRHTKVAFLSNAACCRSQKSVAFFPHAASIALLVRWFVSNHISSLRTLKYYIIAYGLRPRVQATPVQ